MALVEPFHEALRRLLPRGRAWDLHPGGNFERLLQAAGEELAAAQARIDQLPVEADPLRAVELLPEWERSVGLPDECDPREPEPSTQDRQRGVHARLTAQGGQTPASLIELAARLGYEVTIEEFQQAASGVSSSGDSLWDDDWAATFIVHAPLDVVTYAESGTCSSGDLIATWGDGRLECEINRVKPAHMLALFAYA